MYKSEQETYDAGMARISSSEARQSLPEVIALAQREAVTIERTARKAQVTWLPPSTGDPIRYVVAVSINDRPFRIKRSTKGTTVRIPIPKRATTVAVRVLAIDAEGRGPWSEPISARIRR